MKQIEFFLREYLRERPLFLALIRAKEAELYQKYLPLKGPVLDVGVGDGYFANIAFAKNFKFQISNFKLNKEKNIIDVGLDVKNSRMEEARKLNIYKKLIIYDGKKIPYPDNYFATIVSNSVLEHVSDLNNVLREVRRVLRPGGLFLATVMAEPWEKNLFGAKILGDFYIKWMRKKQVHINLFTKGEWDEHFLKAGFTIKERIGHLNSRACAFIDLLHYVSLPSLVSYKLFSRWVLFPDIAEWVYPVTYLTKIVAKNVDPDTSGALFYVLKK